jgi:ketosteroid isomerase-like protein
MHEQDGAFSDVTNDVSRVIEHGDVVVAEWTYKGTHTRPMTMPDGSIIPPTGKTSVTPGVTIITVRDGKVAAARDCFDLLTGMSELGLMSGP